jgi:hypothetical protein
VVRLSTVWLRTPRSSTPKIELAPEQPDAVAEAIAGVLAGITSPAGGHGSGPDPWWQAGLEESLEP